MNAFDSRTAGRVILEQVACQQSTFRDIAALLKTADAQLSGSGFRSHDSAVTWQNSGSVQSPDQWLPRWFARVWRVESKDRSWKKALAIYLCIDPENARSREPWMGCYVLEAT